MKLRFLGLLPLTHAELATLLSGSYPISEHTETGVEEHRGEPDRRPYKGLSISREAGDKHHHNNHHVLPGWLWKEDFFINDLKIPWRLLVVSALCRGGRHGRGGG